MSCVNRAFSLTGKILTKGLVALKRHFILLCARRAFLLLRGSFSVIRFDVISWFLLTLVVHFLAPFSVVHFVPRKRFRRYRVCILMRFVPRKRFMRYEKQFCEKKVRYPASLGASWTFWRLMMISQPEMLTWLPCEFSPSRHDSVT